jgi:hypothetical protein
MSKWSSLIGGAKNVGQTSLEAGAINYSIIIPSLIVLVIVLVLVFKKDSTTLSATALSKPVGVSRLLSEFPVKEPVKEPVVPAIVEKVVEPIDSVVETAPVEGSAPVEAKFHVVGSKYWNFDEQEDEPFLENDGNTFSDFQRAFNVGREIVTEENSMTTFKNENRDTFLHDVKRTFQPKTTISLTDSRTIAIEAYQSVPADVSRENALVILREILAARMEAENLGLDLGSAPEDQLSDLKFWSKSSGDEALIAQKVLSRL